MATRSHIEWTDATWNPVTGCTKISEGCRNCYASVMAKRLTAMRNIRYINGFNVTLHWDLIDLPLSWKRPKRIFVNSMSDLFHESVSDEFIKKVFETMNMAHWHTFQILTKRPERVISLENDINWTPNIWQGVSIENDEVLDRISHLQLIPALIKFLSIEPLIGAIHNLNLKNIDWVIVGGESGPKARAIEIDWVRSIRDQCISANVPFFFKQWGGVRKHTTGRILDGRTWDEFPKN